MIIPPTSKIFVIKRTVSLLGSNGCDENGVISYVVTLLSIVQSTLIALLEYSADISVEEVGECRPKRVRCRQRERVAAFFLIK